MTRSAFRVPAPVSIGLATQLFAASLLVGGVVAADRPTTYPPADGYAVARTVKFDDLDLNTPAGAKKLYGRLTRAVRTVCDARNPHSPAHVEAVIRPCVVTSLNDAVKSINAPLLSAHHRKVSGDTLAAKVAER
jgi:UrcA family protein